MGLSGSQMRSFTSSTIRYSSDCAGLSRMDCWSTCFILRHTPASNTVWELCTLRILFWRHLYLILKSLLAAVKKALSRRDTLKPARLSTSDPLTPLLGILCSGSLGLPRWPTTWDMVRYHTLSTVLLHAEMLFFRSLTAPTGNTSAESSPLKKMNECLTRSCHACSSSGSGWSEIGWIRLPRNW